MIVITSVNYSHLSIVTINPNSSKCLLIHTMIFLHLIEKIFQYNDSFLLLYKFLFDIAWAIFPKAEKYALSLLKIAIISPFLMRLINVFYICSGDNELSIFRLESCLGRVIRNPTRTR